MKKIQFTGRILLIPMVLLMFACGQAPRDFTISDEALQIYPDYTSITIPPNIAPLNFRISNDGKSFLAVFKNSKGKSITVRGEGNHIFIPEDAWKKLLKEDEGGKLTIEVYRQNEDRKWERFNDIVNDIAAEEIDKYFAFRKIPLANIVWSEMGLYQRSIETFEVSPIMVNRVSDNNCMNCHKFNNGNPEQMVFHMRAQYGGTFVKHGDDEILVETKSDHTRGNAAYPSWHPGGNLIAFSVNIIKQGFHAQIGKISYVNDGFSDIIIYDVNENTITRPKELSTGMLENLPSWSADGKSLMYIVADQVGENEPYSNKQYSLVSIEFDEATMKFGKADTLLRAEDFGKSITFPRASPKNKFVVFLAIDYGYFSITQKEADIYFYNKETKEVTKPDINSDDTESAATFSSNGSWLMFISKREDGILSQVWFSHVDDDGIASKPFVLPQKNPDFYDDYLFNYNLPEFITGKVDLNPRKVYSVIKNGPQPSFFNEEGSVSLTTGATHEIVAPEQEGMYPKH